MSLHDETTGVVNTPPEMLFDHLDDPHRLSAHMSRSSAMTLGSRMNIELDAAAGRAVGSKIRLAGHVLGIRLLLEEVVTEHVPPKRKVWQTIGTPRLLVLSHYTMGYEIAPEGAASRLRVFIDYDLPARGMFRWLGRLLGPLYARWCTRQMVKDVVTHFSRRSSENAA
jgi:hypothetical protein